jgi:hypothetical protein
VLLFDKALRRIRVSARLRSYKNSRCVSRARDVYTVELNKEHGSFQGLASETLESLAEDSTDSSRRWCVDRRSWRATIPCEWYHMT